MGLESVVDRIAEHLEDEVTLEAIEKTLAILRNLERSGILDILEALTDPEVIERLTRILISTSSLKLADNAPELIDKASKAAEALVKPVEPATPAKLLASLKDPRVARGIARLIEALKALGED